MSTSSLAAVASRINERNNALRSELTTLELLRAEEEELGQVLSAKEKSERQVRQKLLTAVRSRHGLELECLHMKGETLKIEEATSELRSCIDDIGKQTMQLQRQFDEEHVPIYASHDVSTKVYMMKSEATLERAQTKKRRREEKLTYLADMTKRQQEEADNMRKETKRLRENILALDELEEEEDEDLVTLNMQIKSVLEEKASLRSSLKEVKEVLQNATENRDIWEERCVEASK
mmetsp:Transcript_15648/g.25722  ORF Transcript_15648/g.25722 Transcript_15648/m.25722 type:complete len:234 (-) Transcript_15648:94-795(-)|eukprot:scaffold9048_cov142-Skeletonema_menzelii.AAC.2